jgi:hypothetical protein
MVNYVMIDTCNAEAQRDILEAYSRGEIDRQDVGDRLAMRAPHAE